MQVLLLQKLNKCSKLKIMLFTCRGDYSYERMGKFRSLLVEGRCIQKHLLIRSSSSKDESIAKAFSKLMFQGRVQCSPYSFPKHLIWTSNFEWFVPVTRGNGDQQLQSVRDVLSVLHPLGRPPDEDVLLQQLPNTIPPTQYSLSPLIPWQFAMLFYTQRDQQVLLALVPTLGGECGHPSKQPHTNYVPFLYILRAWVPSLHVVLFHWASIPEWDQFGVGEVFWHIVKAVMKILTHEVTAGLCRARWRMQSSNSCYESAVRHTEGVLLVDTSNTFNTINRKAALHSMHFICPVITTILENMYQPPVRMFITREEKVEILSTKGTTQGDPLGMAVYALAIIPLIHHLHYLYHKWSRYGLQMAPRVLPPAINLESGGIISLPLVPQLNTTRMPPRPI